jgi:preprotein translocase subunit SecG
VGARTRLFEIAGNEKSLHRLTCLAKHCFAISFKLMAIVLNNAS